MSANVQSVEANPKSDANDQKTITPRSQWLGNLAQWVSAVAACVGLTVIYLQVDAIKKNAQQTSINAKEQSARQIFTIYMNWGLQYPLFTAKPVPYETFKDDKEKSLRYEWFVINFLFAYDEIFAATKDDQSWKNAFLFDLPSHLGFICAQRDHVLLGQFYEPTRNLVLQAAADAGLTTCNGNNIRPKTQ